MQSVLRKVHSLFQSEFSKQCDVLLLSVSCILFSLMSSSSCLSILSRLAVASSLPSFFPSVTCHRSQFLRIMWPIVLAFICHTLCPNDLSEVSKFQHYTKLCSECNTWLVSCLYLSPVCWFSSCWMHCSSKKAIRPHDAPYVDDVHTVVLFTFCTCCILRCLVCIIVSCLVCIVVVVLCVLL